MAYRLAELAKRVDAMLVGDPECMIDRVASLPNAGPGSISFLSDNKYKRHLLRTSASAVILTESALDAWSGVALVSENPYLTYAKIAQILNPAPRVQPGIHTSAVVSERAVIDPGAQIGPHCVIDDDVQIEKNVIIGPACVIGQACVIGEDSRLVAGVTLCEQTILGRRVLIHPGAVLGSDGFGLANDKGVWVKIPQLGRVVVGDDVEIGANTTIDRGALEDTVLEEGVKLDNLIQVAHNVYIGAHTAVAGSAGIAGSAKIGRHCTIGGAAGIQGHITIADNVHISGMSKASGSISEAGQYTSGTPLETNAKWLRNAARFRQLDDMARRLRQLEKKLLEKNTLEQKSKD